MKLETLIKVQNPVKLTKKTVVNLLYTGDYIALRLNNCLKPFDVSLQQFNVLRILRGQQGKPLNLFEVQERMINKNSNTTRLIDKLIKKNYVDRTIDEDNRRKIKISITEEGLTFLAKVDVIIDETEEPKIVEKLNTKELEQLNKLLEKLRH